MALARKATALANKRKLDRTAERYNLSAKERAAVAKGVRVEAILELRKGLQKLAEDDKLRRDYDKWKNDGELQDIRGDWETSRKYAHYNNLFSPFLGRSVLDELMALAKRRKGNLRIFEDGAGAGIFLSQMKRMLGERGIKTRTTALVLKANEYLQEKKEKGRIDEVIESAAEEFLPREPQDAIFSLYGSLEYSLPELKKHILSKYAYTLTKGGFACIGLNLRDVSFLIPQERKRLAAIKQGMESSPEKVDVLREELNSIMQACDQRLRKVKGDIITALRKRGFEAEFFKRTDLQQFLPIDVLIIRRSE